MINMPLDISWVISVSVAIIIVTIGIVYIINILARRSKEENDRNGFYSVAKGE